MAEKTAQLNKKTAKTPKAEKPVAEPKTKQLAKTLVRAHARSLHISPRKMRLVTNLVKDMRVNDALTQLQFTNKKAAQMVTKLLQSAAANAENNFSLNRDSLFIKEITCDMGSVMKRSFPRARGSAFMIKRKLSHVNVILEERAVKAKKKKTAVVPKAVKPEKKEAEIETTTSPVTAELPNEENTQKMDTAHIEEPTVKEIHNENDSDLVDEKTSPQNLQK
jgi:large subunit ribosomal protein L22